MVHKYEHAHIQLPESASDKKEQQSARTDVGVQKIKREVSHGTIEMRDFFIESVHGDKSKKSMEQKKNM